MFLGGGDGIKPPKPGEAKTLTPKQIREIESSTELYIDISIVTLCLVAAIWVYRSKRKK